jgi:hypothetical protein
MLYARTLGVSFYRTAMIGRHTLHLSSRELHEKMLAFGHAQSFADVDTLFQRNRGYAEPFFEALGADEVRSFDASDYENATDIHDLNHPLAEHHKGRFTAIIEGGTLEHVFNFPQAIRSCMEMLAVGGHFVGVVPGNNFLGHGFYQFSPELFFRIFSAENGFAVVKMVVYEDPPDAQWFEVKDPEPARQRVELVNDKPTCLGIIAKKTAHSTLFSNGVYQSDYVDLWKQTDSTAKTLLKDAGRRYMNRVPTSLRVAFRWLQRRGPTLNRYNPKFYRKLDIP